jgi:VanZ family protein
VAAFTRHRSSASPLSLAYAALVLYASLYPFGPWRWPPGMDWQHLLTLPWPPWNDLFDLWSNLLGYLPLGALVVLAARRSGLSWLLTWLVGVSAAATLSYGTEVAQQCLPGRHPSLKDFVLNTSGAAAGGLLALAAHRLGWVDRWQQTRERWFHRDSAGALALLALWPLGLLFPTPVPLGMGQVVDRVRELLAAALADVPWASTAHTLLAAPAVAATPLRPLADALITALGLLAPCLVAYSVVQPGWRRVVLAAGALAVTVAAMALATALNFGPQHASAWLTPFTVQGLGAGLLLAWLLAPLSRRMVAGVGLVVLTGLVAGVAQAPDDPYFAQSLQAWEQGRFIRFHGVAQWVGWLWPFAAMGWLFSRLAARDRREP